MTSFEKIPLIALSSNTKFLLSHLINPPKVIPNSYGIPRDWRGLADLFNLSGEIIPSIANHVDPTQHILDIVTRQNSKITMDNLLTILKKMERWDVIDDTKDLFEKDARDYEERMERSQLQTDILDNDKDKQMLTIDDLYRIRVGLSIQLYDAFLLCADEDSIFAEEVIKILEQKHNLKLCVRDRDLIGGVSFEHEAVLKLISERCNRLLVVLSPNFLNSPLNKFFLNYAHALGIDRQQRKIVACFYKECTPPPQLLYSFILDYNKLSCLYDFWGKLTDSIRTVNANFPNEITTSKQKIFEDKPESVTPDFNTLTKVESLNPVKETEKLKKPSKIFSWNSKKSKIKQPTVEDHDLTVNSEVPILNLSSLDSVDELESLPIVEKRKKEEKKTAIKICAKKIKSLVIKS